MSLTKITTFSVCCYAGCVALISGLVWYLQASGFTFGFGNKSESLVCVKEVAVVCKSGWGTADECKEWDLAEYNIKTFSGNWGKTGVRIESKINLTEKYTYDPYQLQSYDIVCKERSNGTRQHN